MDFRYSKTYLSVEATLADLNYTGRRSRDFPPPLEGHYPAHFGELIRSRYLVIGFIARGVDATVVHGWDDTENISVAIKILHAGDDCRVRGKKEVDCLERLRLHRSCKTYIGEMLDSFVHKHHYCIVFEKLGLSLGEMMERNKFQPLSIGLVRLIGERLLECVSFIHSVGLVHTDLNPSHIVLIRGDSWVANSLRSQENLIKLPDYSEPRLVKLIDFSCATCPLPGNNYGSSARAYRAPEVILGFDRNLPSDIWSIGCILLELFSGTPFFNSKDDPEHLSMMQRVLGHPVPKHMLDKLDYDESKKKNKKKKARWSSEHSQEESKKKKARWTLEHSQGDVPRMPRLEDFVMRLQFDDLESGDELLDLLQGLLRYDPADRLTAEQALHHPFFDIKHRQRKVTDAAKPSVILLGYV